MTLVYILYDSISNSIFASQVWNLLITFIKQNKYQNIILISFEKTNIIHNYTHANIKIIQLARSQYLGKICLLWDLFTLKRYLPKSKYTLIARGPFAGYLASWLLNNTHNKYLTKIIFQARGLAAAEYAYSNQTNNIFKKVLVKLRYLQLLNLEKKVYSVNHPNLQIECVSTALKIYLITNFKASPKKLCLAKYDIPRRIKPNLLARWRQNLRAKLNIVPEQKVYCYSGSAHKWQCPDQTIIFFKQKLAQDPQAFLLVLTTQTAFFKQLIVANQIPINKYLITRVSYDQIYKYLAACDFCLLFREEHILNWVSRPTKALEYQSVGLQIMHNNTIDWLIKHDQI